MAGNGRLAPATDAYAAGYQCASDRNVYVAPDIGHMRRDNVDSIAVWKYKATLGFASLQHVLVAESARRTLRDVFLQTYLGCFEKRMNWHGRAGDVPLRIELGDAHYEPVPKVTVVHKSWYEKAFEVDAMADKLHLREQALSSSQQKLASHALQKAVLAKAGQWNCYAKEQAQMSSKVARGATPDGPFHRPPHSRQGGG